MGVAHADAGDVELVVGGADAVEQDRPGRGRADGDLVGLQVGRAHGDADLLDRAAGLAQLAEFGVQHARAGFDRETSVGGGDAGALDQIFGEAAEAVAAHLAVGAVGVDDGHPRGGRFGVFNQQDAVGADAEVAVADFGRGGGPVELEAFSERAAGVDQDEIVARALDFEEGDRHRYPLEFAAHARLSPAR